MKNFMLLSLWWAQAYNPRRWRHKEYNFNPARARWDPATKGIKGDISQWLTSLSKCQDVQAWGKQRITTEATPSEWDAELRSWPGVPVSPRVLFASTGVQVLRFWTGSNLSNYILSPSVPPAASGGCRILVHFLHYVWERYCAAVRQLPWPSPYSLQSTFGWKAL